MLNETRCVGPQQSHRVPEGSACLTAHLVAACAVIGNVLDATSSEKVTGVAGVKVDLYIENTTYYRPDVRAAPAPLAPPPPKKSTVCAASQAPGNNHIKETDRNGVDVKTFFEINVKGPPPSSRSTAPGGTTFVDLTFKFVRRDTGLPVIIPWMQFTLFDFDQNNDGNTGNGKEARGPPPVRTAPARPAHARSVARLRSA